MSDLVSATERAEIEEYRQRFGKPGMTAGEFEPYLPDHLKTPYWRTKIQEVFEREGIEIDEEEAT